MIDDGKQRGYNMQHNRLIEWLRAQTKRSIQERERRIVEDAMAARTPAAWRNAGKALGIEPDEIRTTRVE